MHRHTLAQPLNQSTVEEILSTLTAAALDNLAHISGSVANDNGTSSVIIKATYVGTDAITLTDYNALPKDSVIWDRQAAKWRVKTAVAGSAGFVSSAQLT